MVSAASLLLVGLVATATPVAGQPVVVDDPVAREAVAWVVEELAVLEALGALTADPDAADVLDWMGDPGPVERDTLVTWLEDVDGLNALDLDERSAEGWVPPGPASEWALEALDEGTLDAIADGELAVLDGALYVEAAAELLIAAGAPVPPEGAPPGRVVLDTLGALPLAGQAGLEYLADIGLGPPGAASASRVDDDADTAVTVPVSDAAAGTEEVGDDSRGGGAGAVEAVVVALLLVGLAAMAVVALRRARPRTPSAPNATTGGDEAAAGTAGQSPGPPPGPGAASVPPAPTGSPADLVLDASRVMTASMDGAIIRATAISTAVELLGGDDGRFVRRRGADVTWEPTAPGWAPVRPQDDAVVARAIATAQTRGHVATGPDDQTHAIAAAPVIVDGSVGGAIVVARHGSTPFSTEEVARLDLLTPVAGSAMTAAGELAGAVERAEVDQLTRLRNRGRLDEDLALLLDREQVAFAMIDVDHFKLFNDTNGHAGGDAALRAVAGAIAGAIRPTDDAYRYGGEEFAVLLRGCDVDRALVVLDRVVRAVRALEVPGMRSQPAGRITVSVGIASSAGGTVERLAERADDALYRAKQAGRDRIVVADSELPTSR